MIKIDNREVNPSPRFQEYIETWDRLYQEKIGIKFQYSGADFRNLKLLKARIEKIQPDNPLEFFELYLLKIWEIKDSFYRENFSIPLLNSHFNQILLKIKSHKTPAEFFREAFQERQERQEPAPPPPPPDPQEIARKRAEEERIRQQYEELKRAAHGNN